MTMESVYQNLATDVAAHPHQFGNQKSILGAAYDCYKENSAIESSEMKAGIDVLYSPLNKTEGVSNINQSSATMPQCKMLQH